MEFEQKGFKWVIEEFLGQNYKLTKVIACVDFFFNLDEISKIPRFKDFSVKTYLQSGKLIFFEDFICERERERGKCQREKQIPYWAGSLRQGSIPGPQDHNLSLKQPLNWLSPPKKDVFAQQSIGDGHTQLGAVESERLNHQPCLLLAVCIKHFPQLTPSGPIFLTPAIAVVTSIVRL